MLTTTLLIVHGLLAVALLGAITHQLVSALRNRPARSQAFMDRYTGVAQRVFTVSVLWLYPAAALLGGVIYPDYRLDTRPAFEQMALGWAVGAFELKEHFAGIGLCLLPLYAWLWDPKRPEGYGLDRIVITGLLAFSVWWDFLAGHVLNNIRGLG
jgi:hypothetical protein